MKRLLMGLALAAALQAGLAGAAPLGDWLGAVASQPTEGLRGRQMEEALARLAAQLNRGTPQRLDEANRLDRVTADGTELVYHYTLLQELQDLPVEWLEQRSPLLRERLCGDERMQRILASGARVGYAYRTSKGADVGKLSFRKEDCSPSAG